MYCCNVEKYETMKAAELNAVLDHRKKSLDGLEWVCLTCDRSLKRGKMPCQAKANNLMLVEQPPELKTLTPLELWSVARRIPFMKMVGLPRGRQHGIHGPAVNVPTKVETVCDIFPRLPSQSQLLPLKFK